MLEMKAWDKSWPKGVRKRLSYPDIELHKLFEKVTKVNSVRVYLSILGIDYTFKQVNEYANRFASSLINLGIKKGDRVGILMINVPQFVFAFFGILKAGATAVLISPLLGSRDMQFIIKDSDIRALVSLDILYENVRKACKKENEPDIVILTSLGDLLSPVKRFLAKVLRKLPSAPNYEGVYSMFDLMEKNEPLKESLKCNPKEDIAVIGYTGGTTGTPKGALLTHYNLVSNLIMAREWSAVAHKKGAHKKFLGAVPFFHIIGLTAVMLVAAYYESTIYLVPNPRDFQGILKLIEKNKINYMHAVPTLLKALLNEPNINKYDLTGLEIVFSGAAPLPGDVAIEFEHITGCMMIEAYGLTETSPMIAANPFERDNRKLESVGIPFPDTDIVILDEITREELPLGTIGEICVKGPQVMKGYLNQPEETKRVIIDGYLHTGDLGYMDQDGFIFIMNRLKDMINVSGYKVYPRELEDLIQKELPQVTEACVIGIYDKYSGESVKFFAVLDKGSKLTKEEITEFFKQRVAKYKVPKSIEFRDELPKTMVGKVDRKALREFTSPVKK